MNVLAVTLALGLVAVDLLLLTLICPNQTRKIIGFFVVIGIFNGHIADRCYELSQGGADSVSVMSYFYAAFFRFREQKRYEVSFEMRALTRIITLLCSGRPPSTFVPAD